MTLTLTPMTPMTPFLSGVMTYDADGVTGILRHFCVTMTLTLTPMTPMTPFLSGVMTYDADAVTGLSKKMTLTRDADSGTGDVQPWRFPAFRLHLLDVFRKARVTDVTAVLHKTSLQFSSKTDERAVDFIHVVLLH
ncbi:hypothetical protein GPALN_014779 [Globodera pallida]|nr:hypothetical protein GPALN_014779 [Globodera pallida]